MTLKELGQISTKIIRRAKGEVAWVTISRPAKLNALNTHLLNEFPSAIAQLSRKKKDLLAIVVSGDGDKAFVGGADITEMAQKTPGTAQEFIRMVHESCRSVRECPVPVIGRVNGFALGAGLELAASCDLRVASSKAVFGMPEVSSIDF